MKYLLLSFFVFCMISVAKGQELKTVSYYDGTQKLNGLMSTAGSHKLPAVLILPAWKGIDNEARQAAVSLAKAGYITFIADIYGAGNIPKNDTEASKMANMYKTDFPAYQRRISLALETLKEQGADPERIAVIGYCFGGTGALEAARAGLPVRGVVSIHGDLSKDQNRVTGAIAPKVLIVHPAEDRSVSKQDIENFVTEMNTADADWQFITYAHCGHTFTNPESAEYNPLMAMRAWKHTLLFLEEILK